MTTPSAVIARIHTLCAAADLDFVQRTRQLYADLDAFDDATILTHIEVGGMIPEDIDHDSSEEKLFAKYCDYLLARGLTMLGIPSVPIPERADAADVRGAATIGQTSYTIVGDAKAFRLSRTAKNQKDFKVEALHRWKRDANYAVLLGPMYQYPARSSQIYEQAIRLTVTLLSFSHLGFLITHRATIDAARLKAVWEQYNTLARAKDAVAYWERIDQLICEATLQPNNVLVDYLARVLQKVRARAAAELAHWVDRKRIVEAMSVMELRAKLLQAERIESNIATITAFMRTLERAAALNAELGQNAADD